MDDCLRIHSRKRNKQPAWLDSADKEQDVEEREPTRLEALESGSESEDEDDIDMYANDVRSRKDSLEVKDLRFKHLSDINSSRKMKHDSVRDVSFHPTSKMAMVTLNKGRIDLFEVDGERNSHIHRIKTPYAHRQNAKFKPDGKGIVIASENDKGKFYSYDMYKSKSIGHWLRIGDDLKQIADFELSEEYMLVKEKGGRDILVLSPRTYEILFSISTNDPVEKFKFLSDQEIVVAGENNRVYIYDLKNFSRCKHKFQDQGTLHISSLALSGPSNLLSIGSDAGIVNTYNLSNCLETISPQPIFSHANLSTKVGILEYNHSGELLLMASGASHGAFRLIHSYSGKVYRNFPAKDHKYGHPAGVDFSPKGGYLGLGCTNGQANLIRIPFYKQY